MAMSFKEFVLFLNQDPERGRAYRDKSVDERKAFVELLNVSEAAKRRLFSDEPAEAGEFLQFIICSSK